jgi:hypothetical protein
MSTIFRTPVAVVALSLLAAAGASAQRTARSSVSRSGSASVNRSASVNQSANVNRNATVNRNANVNQNANINRNATVNQNTNINRNTTVNQNTNVNVNRNVVNPDVNVNRYGGGYDSGCCYNNPIARTAAVTATAVATAAIVGSMVNTLPPSCTAVSIDGVTYQQCGSTWYQPQFAGSSVTYIVVNAPR